MPQIIIIIIHWDGVVVTLPLFVCVHMPLLSLVLLLFSHYNIYPIVSVFFTVISLFHRHQQNAKLIQFTNGFLFASLFHQSVVSIHWISFPVRRGGLAEREWSFIWHCLALHFWTKSIIIQFQKVLRQKVWFDSQIWH